MPANGNGYIDYGNTSPSDPSFAKVVKPEENINMPANGNGYVDNGNASLSNPGHAKAINLLQEDNSDTINQKMSTDNKGYVDNGGAAPGETSAPHIHLQPTDNLLPDNQISCNGNVHKSRSPDVCSDMLVTPATYLRSDGYVMAAHEADLVQRPIMGSVDLASEVGESNTDEPEGFEGFDRTDEGDMSRDSKSTFVNYDTTIHSALGENIRLQAGKAGNRQNATENEDAGFSSTSSQGNEQPPEFTKVKVSDSSLVTVSPDFPQSSVVFERSEENNLRTESEVLSVSSS